MGNLLFSPSGRINSAEFMKGVGVLVVITLVLGLLPLISPALAALGVVALVFLWCWVVLWVKRYHDGDKSGWTSLLPIIVYIILGGIVSVVVSGMFVDLDAAAAATEAATEAAEAGDMSALFKSAMGASGLTSTGIIANALIGAGVSYGIAALFNGMIKSDPNDNKYGPAT